MCLQKTTNINSYDKKRKIDFQCNTLPLPQTESFSDAA